MTIQERIARAIEGFADATEAAVRDWDGVPHTPEDLGRWSSRVAAFREAADIARRTPDDADPPAPGRPPTREELERICPTGRRP